MRFHRPMSARPRTFLTPGSALVPSCVAPPSAFDWAARIAGDSSSAQASTRRTMGRRRIRSPTGRGQDDQYTPSGRRTLALTPYAKPAALVMFMDAHLGPRCRPGRRGLFHARQPAPAPSRRTAARPRRRRRRARFPIRCSRPTPSRKRSRNGTRTRVGEPGPNYWQQFAHYTIDAELVPATSRINGRESVRYYNRSPDTLRTLWIELDQNLFAPSSPRVVAVPVTGGTEILRVAASGQALASRDTGAGYSVSATNMEVRLPRALVPHDSVDLDIAWAFQLPPDGAPREGTTGDVFMVAYWYPRLAVYDDVTGLAERPVSRRRRVLHGVRGLRRESDGAAGMAGRGDGRADESERGVVEADPRPSRRSTPIDGRRARRARAGSRRRRDEGDDDGIRQSADVAVPRPQRARLRLGRVAELSVGRDGRRRRRS